MMGQNVSRLLVRRYPQALQKSQLAASGLRSALERHKSHCP